MRTLLLLILSSSCMFGMERAQGWCEQGGKVIVAPAAVGGSPISRGFQQSYARCTVTVYLTGTVTKAAIYSTNTATPLANPFTADQFGLWFFYAADGRYDVQISGGGPPALAAPYTFGDIKLQDLVSAGDFGVVCDGTTDNKAALTTAFASSIGNGLYLPSGTCVINNSAGPLTIPNWSGKFWGNIGSILSCTTLSQGCVSFTTPTNMSIEDVTFTYAPVRTTRNGAQLLSITGGTHIALTHVTAHQGNSAAVLIQQGVDIHVTDLATYDMLANGLFVTNTSYMTVSGLYCNNLQDYCFEASQYDPFAGVSSGTCQFVNVTNMSSVASYSGALFNSCPNSSLSNFSITDTFNAGVVVGQDSATTVTTWPYNVAISNGSIRNTGTTPSNPNAQGIWLFLSTTPTRTVPVSISNVLVYNSAADGVEIGKDSGGDPSNFNLSLSGITVDTAVAGECYRLAAAGTVTFANLQARNCFAYALNTTATAGSTVNVSGSGLFILDAENASRSDPRVTLAANAGNLIINGVTVADDRNPAVGYQLADNAGVGPVWVSEIVSILPHGTLSLSPSGATSQYLIFDFFKYNAQTIQVDATGTACQLTVGGFTVPQEILKLCYDTTGDFGWIQATHTGVGNKLLKLNPNGGGLNLAGVAFTVGTGSPNGSVTGSPGDLYMNNAGGAGTTLYVKESGAATMTGWVGK